MISRIDRDFYMAGIRQCADTFLQVAPISVDEDMDRVALDPNLPCSEFSTDTLSALSAQVGSINLQQSHSKDRVMSSSLHLQEACT